MRIRPVTDLAKALTNAAGGVGGCTHAPRRGTGRRNRWAGALLAGLLFPMVSCGEGGPRLENASRSKEALAERVLEAVRNKDRESLGALLITRHEFEALLWPSLPDKDYTRLDFVWGLNAANTRKGLGQLANQFGGVAFELVEVKLGDEPEAYPDFTLYPGVTVVVRRPDTGEEGQLASFDVLVEYRGRWKLLNYDEL